MKPMGKRILSLLVAVLTFGLMSMALMQRGNETQSSVKDYKYCIFYIQEVGDGLEGEKGREWEYKVSCHYNTEQLTVEYREGVMYQVSFEIYEADGTYRGERGDFEMCIRDRGIISRASLRITALRRTIFPINAGCCPWLSLIHIWNIFFPADTSALLLSACVRSFFPAKGECF